MDRLDELAIFVRIIEEGSLIRAARRLRRSPQAVTRGLAALEDRIGQRLVDRTTRRLAPTEAGLALCDRARDLLNDYAAVTSRTPVDEIRGVVRVTAPVQFGRLHVAPIAMRFLDRYLGARIELVLNDRNLDLIEDGIDIALRIGAMRDSSLSVRRMGEVRRLWVASPDYLKRRGTPETPADLLHHETIQGAGPGAPEWTFRSAPRGAPAHLTARFRVSDIETQLTAARAGRGIARLLSYQVADDLARGTLARVLRACEPPPLPVQLVTKGKTLRAPAVEAFLDLAAETLSGLPVIRAEQQPPVADQAPS
jgi:DNA-binding transcriptional LysR family regulator